MGSRNRKKGFTLVEMIFAFAILAVMTYVFWSLFISSSKQMNKATWLSNSQAKIRTAMQFLRNQAHSASYPTTITMTSVNHDTSVGNRAHVLPAGESPVAAGTDKTLLTFKICQHGRSGIPGEDDKVAATIEVELRVKGKTLEYLENGEVKKLLVDDLEEVSIEKVDVQKDDGTGSEDVEKGAVNLKVVTVHPNPRFTATKVRQTTSLAFKVGVVEGF